MIKSKTYIWLENLDVPLNSHLIGDNTCVNIAYSENLQSLKD